MCPLRFEKKNSHPTAPSITRFNFKILFYFFYWNWGCVRALKIYLKTLKIVLEKIIKQTGNDLWIDII